MEAIISMSKMASALIIGWARMNLLEFSHFCYLF